MSGADRSKWPIVVGGCYRSGTSLVRRVLDAHSRIHCGPEVPFFRDFHGDYRDDPYAHLRFARTARSILPEDELLVLLGGAFVAVHERAAARAGKARWADKAPENVLHAEDWARLLGERRLFVHVARNPLDTLASIERHPFPLTLPSDLEGRISVYNRMVGTGIDLEDGEPERCRTVLYEDLTSEPERVIAELMDWLGERAEPGQLEFNAVSHQSGLEDPKVAATSRVHSDSVGAWREVLSDAQAERVRAATLKTWERADPGLLHLAP